MSGSLMNHGTGDHRMGGIGGRLMIATMCMSVPGKVNMNTAEVIDPEIGGHKLGGVS